jgi:glutathione S-transferase
MAAPRITLYGPRVTPYTEKVWRALTLKRLAFELREPASPDDYRRWSPETGLLPVLEIDGERIADSALILDVLDRRFPEPPLLAADPRAARDQRRLEEWISETFVYHMFRWLRGRVGREPAPEGDVPQGMLIRLDLIGDDGRVKPEFFDTSAGGLGKAFEHSMDDLVRFLGAKPFFFADRISRADLAVFGFTLGISQDRYAGSRPLLEARPPLLAHLARVEAETGG